MFGLGYGLPALTQAGAGGGVFSPASLFAGGEQGGWYDPSDLSTMFQDTAGTTPITAPGQAVARINDKSGRGNHLTQATAGSRPAYQVDGNGNGHLLFNGTSGWMASTSVFPLSGSDKVCLLASAYVNGTGNQGLVSTGIAGNGRAQLLYLAGASPVPRASLFGTAGPSSITVPAAAAPYFVVNTLALDIAGATATDEVVIRQNGATPTQTVAAAGPAGTGNFVNGTLTVGDFSTATVFPFNGRVYGLVIRGGTLSAGQISETELFLADKAGIVF